MGLAPYGDAERLLPAMRRIITTEGDVFRLALEYFTHHSRGVEMTWESGSPSVGRIYSDRVADELGAARRAGEELAPRHIDAAAALQARLEELVLHIAGSLARSTGSRNLCLAGGVALNAVANGRIRAETPTLTSCTSSLRPVTRARPWERHSTFGTRRSEGPAAT